MARMFFIHSLRVSQYASGAPSIAVENFILRPENVLEPAKGRLLISDPFMDDSYFGRTVILLCEHNEEGSFGLVLNRYTEARLDELIDHFPDTGMHIGLGGPVQTNSLFFLHTLGAALSESTEVLDGIYFGGDFEQLRGMVESGAAHNGNVRFFIGYSGWSEGQLEGEILHNSWYVGLVNELPVMDATQTDLWQRAIKSLGNQHAPLANFPSDPSLN